MRIALEIVLPLFALILCGYVFARKGMLSAEGVKGINAFVFYFAMPALLFRTMAASVPNGPINFDILAVYYLAALALFAGTMVLGRLVFGFDLAKQALLAINATFTNTVMLGIPLVFTVFGAPGQLSLLLITSIHSLILITLATVLIEIGLGARNKSGGAAWGTFLSMLRNPLLLSILAGSLWGQSGWSMPASFDAFLRLLTGAALPAALFSLGATLAAFRVGGDRRDIALIVVLKMAVHPALTWLIATQLFDLAPIDTAVVVITAALPTGANPFILAQRYDLYVQRSATAVVVTTALSTITASVLLAWYAPA